MKCAQPQRRWRRGDLACREPSPQDVAQLPSSFAPATARHGPGRGVGGMSRCRRRCSPLPGGLARRRGRAGSADGIWLQLGKATRPRGPPRCTAGRLGFSDKNRSCNVSPTSPAAAVATQLCLCPRARTPLGRCAVPGAPARVPPKDPLGGRGGGGRRDAGEDAGGPDGRGGAGPRSHLAQGGLGRSCKAGNCSGKRGGRWGHSFQPGIASRKRHGARGQALLYVIQMAPGPQPEEGQLPGEGRRSRNKGGCWLNT